VPNKIHIEYSCFDVDDNLLHMPTKVNMINLKTGKKEAVPSGKFAEIRSDKENWKLSDDAFIEFRDDGPRGNNAFLEDLKTTVENKKFAPSWLKFLHILENGYLFALITARGHSPENFKRGVEWIIDNVLTDDQKQKMYNNLIKYIHLFGEYGGSDKHTKVPDLKNFSKNEAVQEYLDECGYYGISYPKFMNKHLSAGAESPEIGKEIALREFMEKVQNFTKRIGASVSFGMSDDDVKNVTHVEKVFRDLKEIYPDTIFRLYDTSKKGYTKKVIEGRIIKYIDFIKETSENTPGLESSIMPYTQFNNMTNALYPKGPMNRMDDYQNQRRRQGEYLAKTSKDILKGKRRKIKKKPEIIIVPKKNK
jgi:hypothetical protein